MRQQNKDLKKNCGLPQIRSCHPINEGIAPKCISKTHKRNYPTLLDDVGLLWYKTINNNKMKDLTQLFKLVGKAVEQNKIGNVVNKHWFINYSGHVNSIEIRYLPHGWERDMGFEHCDYLKEYLTEDGIQSAYWFINSRLKK
jgi:hypothetical protein